MSSYIAFDLDALNVVPDVAAASGMPPGDVAHGLLKLWAWCFRNKTDTVTDLHLAGFFGKPAAASLAAFGFLEASGSAWRVKGADRYLRVAEGRRRGGLKAKANLVPGGRKAAEPVARVEPRSSREAAETEPRLDLGLSPTTDDRTPTTDYQKEDIPHPLQVVWNANRAPTMPAWSATGKVRKKHADVRLKEHPSEWWAVVVKRLAASDFASGRSGKWNATADWLVESPDNATKALEGAYDNKGAPVVNPRAPAPVADWTNALQGEIPA